MPLIYTNRKGKANFFRAAKTAKGAIRYYVTKSADFPDLIDEVPDGFEIYEEPCEARVVLRKIVPSLVTKEEIELVRKAVEKLSDLNDFFIEGEAGEIIIWVSQFNSISGIEDNLTHEEIIEEHGARVTTWMRYFDDFKFALFDEKDRTFVAVRRVLLSFGHGEYMPLKKGVGSLEKLTKKFCPYMGNDTYFNTVPEGFEN